MVNRQEFLLFLDGDSGNSDTVFSDMLSSECVLLLSCVVDLVTRDNAFSWNEKKFRLGTHSFLCMWIQESWILCERTYYYFLSEQLDNARYDYAKNPAQTVWKLLSRMNYDHWKELLLLFWITFDRFYQLSLFQSPSEPNIPKSARYWNEDHNGTKVSFVILPKMVIECLTLLLRF